MVPATWGRWDRQPRWDGAGGFPAIKPRSRWSCSPRLWDTDPPGEQPHVNPPHARAGSILQDSPATALPGHKGSILRGDITLPRSARHGRPGGLATEGKAELGSTGRLGPSSQMPPFPVL